MILKKNNRHNESDNPLFKSVFPTLVLGFQEGSTHGGENMQASTVGYTQSAETVSASHQDESAKPTQLSVFKANDRIMDIKGPYFSRNNDAVAPLPALRSNDSHASADRDRRILNDMRRIVTTEISEPAGVKASHTGLHALYVDRGIGLEYLGLHTRTTLEFLEIIVSKHDPARCKSLPNLEIFAHNH